MYIPNKMLASIQEAYPEMDNITTAYQSNNKYVNFPPIMNDGRSVHASWQPGAVIDAIIRKENSIHSNWEYRKYLVEHSEEIKQHNFKQACNDVGYFVRNENKEIDGDKFTARYGFAEAAVRGPPISDLKQMYLSKEQLQANQVIPSMTQAELVKNWGSVFAAKK